MTLHGPYNSRNISRLELGMVITFIYVMIVVNSYPVSKRITCDQQVVSEVGLLLKFLTLLHEHVVPNCSNVSSS